MYVVALVGLLALAATFVRRGARRKSRRLLVAGVGLGCATLLSFAFLGFWGEVLWFEELGAARRFWTATIAAAGFALLGAAVAAALVATITIPTRASARRARAAGIAVAAAIGAVWGALSWSVILRWSMGVPTALREPIFGRDTGFYLFTLPFYDAVFWLLFLVALVAVGVAGWSMLPKRRASPADARALYVSAGVLALVFAWQRFIARYHLLYSDVGTVHGPGWTDVHVRLPAYDVVAGLLVVVGVVLVLPQTSRALEAQAHRRLPTGGSPVAVLAVPGLLIAATALVGLLFVPSVVQWVRVTPNELALEWPYLQSSIHFTRAGFGLERVEEREFEVKDGLTPELVQANGAALSEVRLWDPHALESVLQQFQAIRLYYELDRVDIDRYAIDGRYRQVMLTPREIQPDNLPASSRTFVNRHFVYTHGYGVAMAPVSDFTKDGLPQLVIRDLPPVAASPSLRIARPEIYYGERTNDFVVVNSKAPELDYPSGAANVYTHYAGRGGVELRGLFRRLVFGWKLGGTELLLSSYPSDESRIMFVRSVRERVAKLAPFLELDHDPYLVVVDGRLQWIVDAYTTSSYFPYSETLAGASADREAVGPESALGGVNYVRNSVKAVVDAYDGSVALYVFDPEDPILRVWQRIYPRLFRPAAEMPAALRAHVRYPEELLNAQGLVYAKFHMTKPDVFYNQEDLWVRASEKRDARIALVEPYYVMWQPPGAPHAELVLMQPYTPKNRQVLNGWIAGMCDGDDYGRLIAYRFSKDTFVLGPQQVDTKIDQSPELSGQLTLWDQHGKRVLRGNSLAIPVGPTVLYVEPIYIQAEAAAYPELRMVVAMDGEKMSHAPTFAEALAGLVSPAARPEALAPVETDAAAALERARRAFDEYVRLTAEGRFEEAGAQLRALGAALAPRAEKGPLPTR